MTNQDLKLKIRICSLNSKAAIIISEDDDELRQDIIKIAESSLQPFKPFKHIRNNNPSTKAHVLCEFAGTAILIGSDGTPELGTYQNLLLLEMDGLKTRKILCNLIK